MNKTPASFYTVRFSDCDLFGHLNNARYIDYFLNAREDHLRNEYNFDLNDFYGKGMGWLVGAHEISYLRPANYNENVFIQTALIKAATDHLLVEMIMMDENKTHIKSVIWTKFFHINIKTGRKENHADEFMEFAKSVEEDIDVSKGYQVRMKEILEQIKLQKRNA